jgi:hypothetical protein
MFLKKFSIAFLVLVCIVSIFFTYKSFSWGFYAHEKINRMAVFTLPSEMIGFYKKHIDYISKHATDADKRRYVIPEEAPRHYIDIEHYNKYHIDSIPRKWDDAVKRYGEDSLNAYGIVPWHIISVYKKLQRAFEKEDIDLILKYSADLGHYVADAHVPLHTTENYNGQLTNQKGIHGFWESRIPELKSEGYNYWTGKAFYIHNPSDVIWNTIKQSHAAVDSVLTFEAKLNASYDADKKYSFENRGQQTVKVYSQEYTDAYDKMLNGMVERRMKASIITLGSLWYSAWVNAGKPDLNRLKEKNISDSLLQSNTEEQKRWDAAPHKELKGH